MNVFRLSSLFKILGVVVNVKPGWLLDNVWTEVPTYMYRKNLGGEQGIFWWGEVIKLLGTMTGCKLNSLMLKLP